MGMSEEDGMLSIGEFSKATSLTIKTIRLYHEKGLLPPARVDASGYRYYDRASVERARIIVELRRLDFPLAECKEILDSCDDEGDLVAFLERQKEAIEARLKRDRRIVGSLDEIIRKEREAIMTEKEAVAGIQEKKLEPVLVAGIRAKGRYTETGKRIGRVARAAGRHIGGKPMNLYYDCEYREEDADFETCFPVKKEVTAPGVAAHELPGGRCLSLIHRGPYEEIGKSYAAIFEEVNRRGLKPVLPTREIYVKGPGMIFRGNPKKYLTEIQVVVEG